MDRLEDKHHQLFTITMEECAELIQACSKMMRTGGDAKYLDDLLNEAGDVLCMIRLLQKYGYLSEAGLEDRVLEKETKLKMWSNLYD